MPVSDAHSNAAPSPDARHAALGLGLGCLVVLGVGVLTAAGWLAWAAVSGQPQPDAGDPRLMAAGLPAQCLALALLATGLAWLSRDGPRIALGLTPARGWALVPLVVPAGHLSDRAVTLVRGALPQLDQGGLDRLTEAVNAPGIVGALVLFGAVICAPLAEELLFRGYIYRGLERGLGAAAAVGLSSLAFALYHVDPVHVAGVLILGLWLGWLRHTTGSLWPCVAAHGANNLLWAVVARAGWTLEPPLAVDAVAVALLVGGALYGRALAQER
jgi:membrane protease YdiL (CAAX protease family)